MNKSYYDDAIEEIKKIDTSELSDDVDNTPVSKVIEKQKVYFWIRLYINKEDDNIKPGDDIIIKWKPSGETLKTIFIAYGKKGLEKDHVDQVINYDLEEDERILSLMVDTDEVNNSDKIPFIRTLFKTSYHYEYQLVKRTDLVFLHKDKEISYYDVDF
jgi:hypothetical protein